MMWPTIPWWLTRSVDARDDSVITPLAVRCGSCMGTRTARTLSCVTRILQSLSQAIPNSRSHVLYSQKEPPMPLHRRTFLLAGGALAAHAASPADQVVLGVIGSGGRGTLVMTVMQKDPGLRVGAICDVYEPNLERSASTASKVAGTKPKLYRNYKELLADPDV